MRFAGDNSGNRGANYAAAGKAGADALAQSFATMRKTGPQYDELSKTAMAVEAEKQQAAWKAQARVGTAAIKANETVTKQGIVSKAEDTLAKREASRIRKAGMLAGVSSVLGGAAVAAFGGEDDDDSWKSDFDAQRDAFDKKRLEILQRENPSETRAPFEFKDYPTAPPLQGGSNSPKSTGGSNDSATATDQNTSGAITTFDQAVGAATRAGIKFPRVAAAQWAVESAYGKSLSGTHNYFGIKASGNEPSTSKSTWEVINGQEVNTTANFKNFNSPEEAGELNTRWYQDYKGYSGVGNALAQKLHVTCNNRAMRPILTMPVVDRYAPHKQRSLGRCCRWHS